MEESIARRETAVPRSSSWICGQEMTGRLGIWILRILTYAIWGIVALLALAFLSLIVLYAGAGSARPVS